MLYKQNNARDFKFGLKIYYIITAIDGISKYG